ncbi:MAG: LysM peptidoglycan-binding domain-containing protein [Paludibacteraceae bacterium]|nr:LysM peptidoglycan-binding domain-containing protein [Paludibacteraceae bacterium]
MTGRFFASILASLSVSMVLAGEYPTKIVGGKPYYEYSVAKSEGFYSISKKFGVTQAEIQEANPQTKNGLKEGEHLLIPKKNTQGVMHKVQKSETLFSLKQKYGLTYDDLYEANPSLKTRGLIEGTNIRIPQKKELVARRNKAEKEASEPVKNTPAPVVTKPVEKTSSTPAATPSATATETNQRTSRPNFAAHEVKKGETLYSISKQHNVAADEIVKLNPDAKEGVKIGQILIIPPTYANTSAPVENTTKKSELKTHIVKKGETVYSISKQYGISQDALVSRNPGIDTELQEGKMLIIPPVFQSNSFVEPEQNQAPSHKIHIVKQEETIFGICKQYQITQEDLIKANPDVANGLMAGKILRIPLNSTEIAEINTADSISTSLEKVFNSEPKTSIECALALPWNFAKVTETSKIDANTERFIEFYNGMLLAVDTLRKTGLNINLRVYDSGKTDAEAQTLVSYNELKSMDFIIGPAYQSQIKTMADFALANNVKLVIPFTSKSEEVKNNASVFQINAPQNESAADVALQIAQNFKDYNVVIVSFSDPKYNDKAVWADTLKFTLDAMGVKNKDVVFSNYTELKKTVDKKKKNLIFPVTTNQVALNQILPIINMLKAKDTEIAVFGFNEWQNYNSISKELFHYDTYFTSPFFIDFKNEETIKFLKKYRLYYNAEPTNSHPMYAILGYDMMMYFCESMQKYGHDFEWALDKIAPSTLQSDFKFNRVGETGGFINSRHFIIENSETNGCKMFAK